MTQRFSTDRLDSTTQAYLKTVISAGGRRMPGIYHSTTNAMPAVGLVIGILIVVLTLLVTFPPTEEPTKEAFLQTAGFLLAGWLITAAIRVWIARSTGKSFGNFIYADSQHLYEVSGREVEVTNLENLVEAKATQSQGESGYAGTAINLILSNASRKISINSQIPGKRMTVFLNALAYIRHGGEDGTDEKLMNLSSFDKAAYARHIAFTGEFPRSVTEVEEIETMEIPNFVSGTGSGGSSGGFLAYVAIIVAAVLLFVSFRTYNKAVRDDTIYARILELNEKERTPALRMYLSHPEFNAHREEAISKLKTTYSRSAESMINGSNVEFKQALRDLVTALAEKPQPVLSLSVEETDAPAGDNADIKGPLATELADKWGSTIGDELITFVRLEDPQIKAMVHLVIRRQGQLLEYTFTFRKGPDDPVFQTINGTYNAPIGSSLTSGFANYVLSESCGAIRFRQIPIDQDF